MNLRAVFSAAALMSSICAFAQNTNLTIGDPAPKFTVEGTVKGTPLTEFESGKVYIVEFWATWCGPCISSMPHLSELADKWRGKVEMYSVNVWDRNQPGEKTAGDAGHVKRVTDWVTANDNKMRYNVVLDDASETMSNTWMRAAGRNGIPCAFVVDQDGTIAWIGHPMDNMDDVVEKVYNKTWDKASFKKTFDEQAAKAKYQSALAKSIGEKAKSGTFKEFQSFWAGLRKDKEAKEYLGSMSATAIAALASKNPDDALSFVKDLAKNEMKGNDSGICMQLSRIVSNKNISAQTKAEAVKMSGMCASMAKAPNRTLTYAYHAQVLLGAGDKASALEWVAKAKETLDSEIPENNRAAYSNFLKGIETRANQL